MAETLKFLRKRLRSIKNTEHITHAMEMVSANKLRRTEAMVQGNLAYFDAISELLKSLWLSVGKIKSPLTEEKKSGATLYVVCTSDRGFCGPFNSMIMRLTNEELKSVPESDRRFYFVGRKGKALTSVHKNVPVLGEKYDFNGKIVVSQTQEIFNELKNLFLKPEIKEVKMIFFGPTGGSKSQAQVKTLFPFTKEIANEEAKAPKFDFIYEPSEEGILLQVFEEYLDALFYRRLLQQMALEHRFRLVATNSATKNCQKLIETLTLRMNKARQAAITRELIDIVGGAAAVS